MKHFKRLKIYKASNVTFNPETLEAYSYRWWLFVSKINGLVVFNAYRYSNSTSGHQSKVRRLLDSLGIKTDLVIEAPKGLQDLDSAISYYERRIEELKELIDAPRSHKNKNIERKVEILNFSRKIEAVKGLINGQNGQKAA